jgi:integrase
MMRGHLKQRAKGSWTIWLELPRDPSTGKRRQQTLTIRGTKRDAERKLAELQHQIDSGGYVSPAKLTVGEYLQLWLRDYAATSVRPQTLAGYRDKIETHLVLGLGGIPLAELRPAHLKTFYLKALESGRADGTGGLSASSVAHLHRILSKALSDAVRSELVARNVAEAVDPPRIERREVRTLNSGEVSRFLEAARKGDFYTLFLLAVHTGMRRSELLGLRWRDVDLDLATLSVVQAAHELPGGRIIYSEPKSAKGRRLVALTPSAVVGLRAHRERQEQNHAMLGKPLTESDLAFSHPDGSPIKPGSVTHAFKWLAHKLGFHGVRFHDLRHTHASLMLAQGVHPKIVSERLGHATVSITLDTYSHVTPGLQEAAAKRFEEGLIWQGTAPLTLP